MSLQSSAADLPTSPGVYLFKNSKGKVLYVGKARSLRARVRQYLSGTDGRQMIPFLVRAADDVECIVTDTEKEALILENTLIKKYRPRYNIKLRDDTNFLHLRLNTKRKWPRFELVRSIRRDGSRYFGPYHSASKARHTLAFLQRAFPMRTCTDAVLKSRTRPCLLHQMARCVAPCVPGKTTLEEYSELVEAATDFLRGKHKETVKHLKRRMLQASEEQRYEDAARVRDLLFSLRSTLERQNVVDAKLTDRDAWGIHRAGTRGAIAKLPFRAGSMGEPTVSFLTGLGQDDPAVWSAIINQAYHENTLIPPEILVPVEPEGHQALQEVLTERRGARVYLRVPQRGQKNRLVDLATNNARQRYLMHTDEEARHSQAMDELARVLRLKEPPRRIECFDNSHVQGAFPVAAMAVFIEGRPKRSEYRRYHIKSGVGGDDYGSMREILHRRFTRGIRESHLPDLLVVDGGKGQLSVAVAVLQDLGLHDQAVCAIAKPRTERKHGDRAATDKIFQPNLKEALKFRRGNSALRILQHIRDEVHNTAIRFHRKIRSKDQLVSVLEGIDGVGPKRRNALLKALGSADAVADASLQELQQVPGIPKTLATSIYELFHSS